jgi:hypothetical protein
LVERVLPCQDVSHPNYGGEYGEQGNLHPASYSVRDDRA